MNLKHLSLSWLLLLSFSYTIAQPALVIGQDSNLILEPSTQVIEEIVNQPLYDLSIYKAWAIIETKTILWQKYVWFTPWYCTAYVANKRSDLFQGIGENKISGDAKDWLSHAKNVWLLTGKEPKEWSIAVFAPGKGWWSRGHVAYVEYVGENGLIVVSDMNFKGKYIVTTRVISADLAVWYIY